MKSPNIYNKWRRNPLHFMHWNSTKNIDLICGCIDCYSLTLLTTWPNWIYQFWYAIFLDIHKFVQVCFLQYPVNQTQQYKLQLWHFYFTFVIFPVVALFQSIVCKQHSLKNSVLIALLQFWHNWVNFIILHCSSLGVW